MYSPSDLALAIKRERKAVSDVLRRIAERNGNTDDALRTGLDLHRSTLNCLIESARVLAAVKGGRWDEVMTKRR